MRYSASRPIALLGGWLLLTAVLTACGGNAEPEITPATVDADRLLYERGSAALDEGDWMRAREYFLQLRDGYPQSPLRSDARLGVAQTYEQEGTVQASVNALTSYQEYLSLYPTNPRAPFAQYRLAMVYFDQMKGPERDQTDTRNAIREFETFIQRYPNSELMPEVREHLRLARDRLSESELMIGQYYYDRGWWPGAIDRFRSILDTDPGFTNRDAVYFYLADALTHSNQRAEAEESVALFERLQTEFPESPYIDDARESLARVEDKLATMPVAGEGEGEEEAEDALGASARRSRAVRVRS